MTTTPLDNPNFDKEALDCWNAFLVGTLGKTGAPTNTGIFASWKSAWLNGHIFGPPLTLEYQSVDRNGTQLHVQEFPGARAEYNTNDHTVRFYSTDGEVKL